MQPLSSSRPLPSAPVSQNTQPSLEAPSHRLAPSGLEQPEQAEAESASVNPLRQGQGQTRFAFVDDPPPRPERFGGYASLAVRYPEQILQGAQHTAIFAQGNTLTEAVESLRTPEAVTALLQPFGSLVYDYDRANKGTGTGGAQSPTQTLQDYSGICRDSHHLGAYLLQENGYDAIQIGYKSEGVMHAVLSYAGKDGEGFGLIEYGTHYSPEQIASVLGRPALSHEEALLAVRPEAKLLNRYTRPAADEVGHISGLFYSMGHLLYQETLQLNHENSLNYSPQRGLELEAALNENWGLQLQLNNAHTPDPTARDAASLAVGYQTGNSDHWLRASVGVQYRPEEGHHRIGSNQWESHPAWVTGGHLSAQWTPLQAEFNPHHRTETRLNTHLTGALAWTQSGGTDAANGEHPEGLRLNEGLSAGLNHATLRVGQHFSGEISDRLSYQTEIFINPDIMAAAYGYGTGGSGMYANAGINGRLQFNSGNWETYLGGQYLLTQVNNLEATGVHAGLAYTSPVLGFQAQTGLIDSPEGLRLQTRQQIDLKLTDTVQAFGYATQEQIFNPDHGHVSSRSGQQVGLGIRANF